LDDDDEECDTCGFSSLSIGTGDEGDELDDKEDDEDNERGKLFVADKSSFIFVSCRGIILFKTRSSFTEDDEDIDMSDVAGEFVPFVLVVTGVIEDDRDGTCN
jgi:hypothetical protein